MEMLEMNNCILFRGTGAKLGRKAIRNETLVNQLILNFKQFSETYDFMESEACVDIMPRQHAKVLAWSSTRELPGNTGDRG